ncbi:hypothetical protein GLYMA_03G023300v4 [Glycine max]|uniref:Uncharacterized protein n=1 Tax=Glycine max TaxID=3847 RepID=K7KCD9_SOYBN|nr:hypothetical protein JHK85_006288 [Glycine max]KAH1068317.1 hypothetical protein GYH30_006030 [Glycine max]KRH65257.1 hypothetical protein GLYMA_03G023300v4 [Glycine max]
MSSNSRLHNFEVLSYTYTENWIWNLDKYRRMQETMCWLIYMSCVQPDIFKHHKTCKYHQLHPLIAGKQTDAAML